MYRIRSHRVFDKVVVLCLEHISMDISTRTSVGEKMDFSKLKECVNKLSKRLPPVLHMYPRLYSRLGKLIKGHGLVLKLIFINLTT